MEHAQGAENIELVECIGKVCTALKAGGENVTGNKISFRRGKDARFEGRKNPPSAATSLMCRIHRFISREKIDCNPAI